MPEPELELVLKRHQLDIEVIFDSLTRGDPFEQVAGGNGRVLAREPGGFMPVDCLDAVCRLPVILDADPRSFSIHPDVRVETSAPDSFHNGQNSCCHDTGNSV